MRVLFLVHDNITLPLGISYLSSILKAHGHEVTALVTGDGELVEKACAASPDLIAFGCTTGFHGMYMKAAARLRESVDAPTIMGGSHPTFFPGVMQEHPELDFAMRGEAEESLLQFLDALEGRRGFHEVGNLMYRDNGTCRETPMLPLVAELDSIPFPDRFLLPGANRNAVFVITGRGCPYGCSYCFNESYRGLYRNLGKMRRRRSVGNVLGELAELRASMDRLQMIVFQDDIFIMEPEWVSEFCERYPGEIGLPFHCHLRANLVTPAITRALADAGCISVKMAIETRDDHLRNDVLRRSMSVETMTDACRAVKDAGIVLVTQNILGIPGSNMANDIDTLDLNRRIRPSFCFATLLQPYPGTVIHDYCVEKGFLEPGNTIPDSFFDRSVLRLPHGNRVGRLRKLFALAVEFPVVRWMLPLLMKLPLDRLYDFADKLWKGYCIKRREFPYRMTVGEYARDITQYFRSRYY